MTIMLSVHSFSPCHPLIGDDTKLVKVFRIVSICKCVFQLECVIIITIINILRLFYINNKIKKNVILRSCERNMLRTNDTLLYSVSISAVPFTVLPYPSFERHFPYCVVSFFSMDYSSVEELSHVESKRKYVRYVENMSVFREWYAIFHCLRTSALE